jgi:hypothetical protein
VNNFPRYLCAACTYRYGGQEPASGTTSHVGRCDVCGDHGRLTEPRDYGAFLRAWRDGLGIEGDSGVVVGGLAWTGAREGDGREA